MTCDLKSPFLDLCQTLISFCHLVPTHCLALSVTLVKEMDEAFSPGACASG
ncbi:hypothetical protein CES85_2286 [Ochrobactrum quorumnocens]|uniref:Uncharacterized protein n=1 Tax=Ochrobactrum quorumnocens TaxID=271865 RepID=A0A248UIS8_9HYPH|nr:hypothetical protein CES85_2286 [[Ochrobactrum] quorumnocens]